MIEDIQKLKDEKKRLETEAGLLYGKARNIEKQILSMTTDRTKEYYDKYVKMESHGYCRYIHIMRVDTDCGEWILEGPGFTTYEYEDGSGRHFSEEVHLNFVTLRDLEEDSRWNITFLSKEEFFAERASYIKEFSKMEY